MIYSSLVIPSHGVATVTDKFIGREVGPNHNNLMHSVCFLESDKVLFPRPGARREHHRKMRDKYDMSSQYAPWTAKRHIHLLKGVPESGRDVDMLDIFWRKRPRAYRTLPWFVDLSQCVSRQFACESMRCLTQSSRIYSYARGSVIAPEETLLIMGLPAWQLRLDDVNST